MAKNEIRYTRGIRTPQKLHLEEWNSSFWVSKLPTYNRLIDKHSKTKPSLRVKSAIRNYRPSNLISLQKKTREDTKNTSTCHSSFRKSREQLKGNNFISKEIEQINKEHAAILNAIHEREELLEQLARDTSCIPEYRLLTLDLFEKIKHWASKVKLNTIEFEWNGENYIEKLKSDVNFLTEHSELFRENDPFVVSPLENSREKIDLSTFHRINIAMKDLELKPFSAFKVMYYKPSRIKPLVSTLESLSSPKIPKTKPLKVKNFAENYFEQLLELCWQPADMVRESQREMVNASLTLYSSTILNKYINQILDHLIPEVQREASIEEINLEYLASKNSIENAVIDSAINEVISSVFIDIYALSIAEDLIQSIDFAFLAKESINEEGDFYEKFIEEMGNFIIDECLQSEWIEQFIEGEILQCHLHTVRSRMPTRLQNEIFLKNKQEFYEQTAEDFYFDILNEYVADLWLHRLVASAFAETESEDIEDIFYIPKRVIEPSIYKR